MDTMKSNMPKPSPATPHPAQQARDMVIVPREPTTAMIEAFHTEDGERACNKWDAMLAAAPAIPAQQAGQPEESDLDYRLAMGWGKPAEPDGSHFHAALQQIGYALGLQPGADLLSECLPAIERRARSFKLYQRALRLACDGDWDKAAFFVSEAGQSGEQG